MPIFWNEKEKQMRVMLRAREQASSAVKNDLIAAVERIGREVLDQPNAPAHMRIAGVYLLLNHLVGGLMSDQLNTLLLATAAVFSIMCIACAAFGWPSWAWFRRLADTDGPRSDGLARRAD